MIAYVAERPGAVPAPEERAPPALGPDDLLVEVEAAVVAGPELATIDAGRLVAPGAAAVGRVAATGEAAADHLGRRVLVGPLQACGECDACRRGRLSACPAARRLGIDVDGALASHVVARRRWVCPLDGPLAGAAAGPEAAALAREAPLAYAMLARAGVSPGEVTVWLGPGPVAQLGRRLAVSKGAQAPEPGSGDLALEPAALVEALAARLDPVAPVATWKVFETTGKPVGRRRALALGSAGATVVLASPEATGVDDEALLPLGPALDRDAAVLGVASAHPDLVPEVAALQAKGDLALGDLVRVWPPEALGDLLAALRSGAHGDRLAVVRLRA